MDHGRHTRPISARPQLYVAAEEGRRMPSKEHEALVEAITASGHPPTPEVKPSLEHLQAAIQNMNDTALAIDPDIATADEELGGVPALWFRPPDAVDGRVILYFHGGGYMFGSPRNTGHVTARLARAARCCAFSLDYRLSWKAPFPAPVEDALAAYRALLALGYEPSSIALAGDSAGGGLVIATLVALREAGDPLPAAGFASSAFTDCTVSEKAPSRSMTRSRPLPACPCSPTIISPVPTLPRHSRHRCSRTCADYRRCCCKWALARHCSTTRPASPSAPAPPELTSPSKCWPA